MARCQALSTPIVTALTFGLLLENCAEAIEFNLPDPPGAIVFEPVRLKVVTAPALKVPEGCDPGYRAQMETSFRKVWEQCAAVGRLEPSTCQRSLFDRCTRLAVDYQKMESGTCLHMHGEAEALRGFREVDSQKSSQDSAADLNRRAYLATMEVVRGLEQDLKNLEEHRKRTLGLLSAPTCGLSTASAQYDQVEKKVAKEMSSASASLSTLLEVKKSSAQQFAKNSGLSQKNLEELASLPPAGYYPPASLPPSGSTISVQTQTATITSTVVTTTVTPAKSPLILPPSSAYEPPKKKINWVPILAVGVPAAILAGIAISKLSQNQAGTGGGDTSGGGGDGAGEQGRDPVAPRQQDTEAATIPGGGDLQAWNITLDPSFTDAQKATIAAGFQKIPACYRYKLKGLYVKSARLDRTSDGCVAGMFRFGGNTVWLSPTCTVSIGVTAHEFFHVIGNRNGNALHGQFRSVVNSNPGCPVTEYAKTNFYEDFAETGRLTVYPASGGRFSASCVDRKIEGMNQILNNCPSIGQ